VTSVLGFYDSVMDEILEAFSEESKTIIVQMLETLEKVDEDPSLYLQLGEFARLVDGIMGSAKVIALDFPPEHTIQKVASFSELCKFLGQQGTKVENSAELTPVLTAFLLDASESLQELNSNLTTGRQSDLSTVLNATFLKRLRALAEIFDNNRKTSDAISTETANSAQADIDSILRQLGN
jgi:chemotaxis protein histidine kinase CheA